jgi:type IV pilus assembly protein PilE
MSAQKKVKRGFTPIKSGFTLIELLITVAIIGILSAAVLVGINPEKKIAQANDSKVKSVIGQIATAAQSYYISNFSYPSAVSNLVTLKELTADLTSNAPTGYTYTFTPLPNGCTGTAASMCTSYSLSVTLKAPLNSSNTLWCYSSTTGKAVEATACP